jgi:phosphomannomutase
MSEPTEHAAEYRCPGGAYPIGRAVHLARMARFYPACRACSHRDDTATHSARLVRRLVETRGRATRAPLFHDEGASGVWLNDLGPATARKMAAALGFYLRNQQPDAEPPVVLVAGDGRPIMAEPLTAIAEGLRWTGCHVVDLGRASAGSMAFALGQLSADGGLLLGNPGRQHMVGVKFYERDAAPLSAGGPLEMIQDRFENPMDRPTRRYGSLRRLQADGAYLAWLAEHYHALRPLRLVLDAPCRPLADHLARLVEPFDIRITTHEGPRDRLPEAVLNKAAHFAARVDDDGETCEVWDERGQTVAAEGLLVLVAGHLLGQQPSRTVVVERDTSAATVAKLSSLSARIVRSGSRPSEMHRAMRSEDAPLGGGPSGRFWYAPDGHVVADALFTLTWLLVILSRSDRAMSRVLDAASR